jgi:aspartyl-tRNA(Asn)/glutamyl-tRNA(Gln) amidotransferase subunit B
MRSKEDAHDYRYFPEPDLPPLVVTPEFIDLVKQGMPELPDAMRDRFMADFGLSFADASQMVAEKGLADYYERTANASGNSRVSANFISSELTRELNNASLSASDSPVSAEDLASLIRKLDNGDINNNQAKEVLVEMFAGGKTASEVIAEKGFEQVSDSAEIERIVDQIIASNESQVNAYRGGNEKLFGFFVGQVMKASEGKANPKIVNEILRQKL